MSLFNKDLKFPNGAHSRAPLRLGLAGGGTDVAPYSDMYGGRVLNATISMFTHCHIELIQGNQLEFIASDFDISITHDINVPIELSGSLLLHKAVYRRISEQFLHGRSISLRVTTYSDAPPGSGIGSSSALVVAMVQAYAELFQLPLGEYDVAYLAFQIERVDCGLSGGKQDQYASAFGGFNFMEFEKNNRVIVNPLRLKREYSLELESRLILYYTGKSRDSARIIDSQIAATKNDSSDAIDAMHTIRDTADEMKEALLQGRISDVLDILGQSWHAKKRAASGITNSHIELIAQSAISAGARGLKISGAGGGGFMMIAVDPNRRNNVVRSLENHGGRVFSFAFIDEGVQAWKTN